MSRRRDDDHLLPGKKVLLALRSQPGHPGYEEDYTRALTASTAEERREAARRVTIADRTAAAARSRRAWETAVRRAQLIGGGAAAAAATALLVAGVQHVPTQGETPREWLHGAVQEVKDERHWLIAHVTGARGSVERKAGPSSARTILQAQPARARSAPAGLGAGIG